MEKYREKRRPCYLAFLNLEKAYDRVPRVVFWNSLRGRDVPERLISVIKDTYEGLKAAVRTPHRMTKKMDITVGTILYVDDIALVADSRKERRCSYGKEHSQATARLKVRKTKFISSEQCTEPILDCQGEVIEKVEQFRYIGSDLSEEGSVDQAVKGRISAAWLKRTARCGNEEAQMGMWMDPPGQSAKRGC
ncbi:unnamed protein product [Heligmosomoides polygyrus]|uniref:Reverse transcriptase domain-containing protein n=1 Tax=Heligmosomoides polygyrus TaxID=6339 RepID=A0A183GNN7_HELPZ|nr:unnamed protein product [Heligmosomoides polygyrus]